MDDILLISISFVGYFIFSFRFTKRFLNLDTNQEGMVNEVVFHSVTTLILWITVTLFVLWLHSSPVLVLFLIPIGVLLLWVLIYFLNRLRKENFDVFVNYFLLIWLVILNVLFLKAQENLFLDLLAYYIFSFWIIFIVSVFFSIPVGYIFKNRLENLLTKYKDKGIKEIQTTGKIVNKLFYKSYYFEKWLASGEVIKKDENHYLVSKYYDQNIFGYALMLSYSILFSLAGCFFVIIFESF